jgi:hypothetical protein
MDMGPQARKEYLDAIRVRYRRADRPKKSKILDEMCAVCGFHRKHAIRLLGRSPRRQRRRPGPPVRYDRAVVGVLKTIWLAAEQPCSKRLAAALPLWLPAYERTHPLEAPVREKVLRISPATIDRLLRPIRLRFRGRALTRPGSLLRSQIPVRAGPWDEQRPGFMEADTVAHCGGSIAGDFVWSITYTDIASGWTQCRAVWNRGATGVVEQTRAVEADLPFKLLGFDCDNGSEFLNHHLLRYFADRPRPVIFTRCRPYKKNDQAHVEQKNWTHVRQLLGYGRLERPEMIEPINRLYRCWGLLHNFFSPNLKLAEKRREGSRTIKKFHRPQTPCQRLLDNPYVEEAIKKKLKQQFEALDPFVLKKQVERRLRMVFDTKRKEKWVGVRSHPPSPPSQSNIFP